MTRNLLPPVSEGVFLPDGTFVPLPKLATEPFLKLWEQEVFALLLAEVTQHIPDAGEHLLRYYGWYSNKPRGQRAQRQPPPAAGTGIPVRSPTAREARKGWAALIKQVYEANPLCCPRCGAELKIIAFMERHQTDVIEKIFRHCGLWEEQPARGPPVGEAIRTSA